MGQQRGSDATTPPALRGGRRDGLGRGVLKNENARGYPPETAQQVDKYGYSSTHNSCDHARCRHADWRVWFGLVSLVVRARLYSRLDSRVCNIHTHTAVQIALDILPNTRDRTLWKWIQL